jgi:hypothetical protein
MIPVSFFLWFFFAFLAGVAVLTFFNAYHLVRYGKAGMTTIVVTTLYLATVAGAMIWSGAALLQVNWDATISPFSTESESSLPFMFPSSF